MAKKSLYIFLTSLLGLLLFLILHRIVVFFYLYLIVGGYIASSSFEYIQFLVLDYFTLTLTMMLGAWYGIWLGMYWYEKVYEEKSHGGVVDHIAKKYFVSRSTKNLETKISAVKERLETDLVRFENLAKSSLAQAQNPVPIKRQVVRKRAPRKLSS